MGLDDSKRRKGGYFMVRAGGQSRETLQESGYTLVKHISAAEAILVDEFGQEELWAENYNKGYAVTIRNKPYAFVGKLLGKRGVK